MFWADVRTMHTEIRGLQIENSQISYSSLQEVELHL
jgi:hypothetical protein